MILTNNELLLLYNELSVQYIHYEKTELLELMKRIREYLTQNGLIS